MWPLCGNTVQEAWRRPLISFWPGSEGKVRCTHNHSQALQQHEAPNSNKNHSALENTTQCGLPGRLLLPARLADEIMGGVCRRDGGLPTIVWSQVDRAHRVGPGLPGLPHHRTCAGPFSGSPPRLLRTLIMRARAFGLCGGP